MKKIYPLALAAEADFVQEMEKALNWAKQNPGTTIRVAPGKYEVTTPLAREAQAHVMKGDFGKNPEPIMFSPTYVYDRMIDLDGQKNTTIEGYGVTLLVNGFAEIFSVRNAENVTIKGFTVDHKRKPYSKGMLSFVERDGENLVFDARFEEAITEQMPMPRFAVYSVLERRFDPRYRVMACDFITEHTMRVKLKCEVPDISDSAPREFYIWHTYHSRPVVLIQDAKNTVVEDVTIHSAPGMGVTAMHGENITIRHLRVVPSAGEHMSTNTDATHFASCRGKLVVEDSEFDGQGDDTINVHTYYYTPTAHSDHQVTLEVRAITGTHTQSVDYMRVGDTLEMMPVDTLEPVATYKVLGVEVDFVNRACTVTVDKPLSESLDGMRFACPDETPYTIFRRNNARNHFARSILIKSRRALIEDCTILDVYEVAVKVAAEASWSEGVNSKKVVIRRNRFVGCGVLTPECGGIAVTMNTKKEGPLSHGEIIIEDNIIEAPYSQYAITLRKVKRAKVLRNELSSLGERQLLVESAKTKLETDEAFDIA